MADLFISNRILNDNKDKSTSTSLTIRKYTIPKKLIWFCLFFCLFMLLLVFVFLSVKENKTNHTTVTDSIIIESWEFSDDNKGNSYVVKDVNNLPAFALQSNNTSVSVMVTDQDGSSHLIYESKYNPKRSRTPEYTWHVINIPEYADTITLQFGSNVDMHDVYIGYSSDIVSYIWHIELLDVILTTIITFAGFFLCSFYAIHMLLTKPRKLTLYMGLICIMFANLHMSNLYMGQMIVRNEMLLYGLYYIAQFSIPILLCLCAGDITGNTNMLFIVIHTFVSMLSAVSQLFETQSMDLLIDISAITICYSWFAFIAIGIILSKTMNLLINHRNYMTIIMITCLLIGMFGIVISFSGTQYMVSGFVAEIGILSATFVMIFNELRTFSKTINESHNVEMYKTIASKDSLTGLGNRYAFTAAASKIPIHNLCIISFDINDLKFHNDTYGHKIGDKLLCDSARVLAKIYGHDNVFRLGGDEFVACVNTTTIEAQENNRKRLNDICEQFNKKSNTVKIRIAAGYSFGTKKDKNVDAVLNRADKEMYENKAYLKEQKKEEAS